jgi:hypothetical protein
MSAWNRGGLTMNRICVDVSPAVVVPPPVTVKVTVREPGEVNVCCTVRPVRVGPPLETAQENVAAGSNSVPVNVTALPASTSQLPLNWFRVAPDNVYSADGRGGPPWTMLTVALAEADCPLLVT